MKAFEVQDLFRHRKITSIIGNAGQSRLVVGVAQPKRRADSTHESLWLIDPERQAPIRLTSRAFNASSAVLDREGNRVAFLSVRDSGGSGSGAREAGDNAKADPGDIDTRGNRSGTGTGTGGKQIYVLRFDGGEAQAALTSIEGLKSLLMWSPDGTRVLASVSVPWREDDLDDTEASSRPRVVHFLPYKRDAQGALVGRRRHVHAIDVDRDRAVPLVEGDTDVSEARWSPDGSRLAFVRTREGRQRHRSDLWIADADGAHPRRLSEQQYGVSGLTWSPDGSRIAFGGSCDEGTSLTRLFLCRVDDGTIEDLGGKDLQLEAAEIVWSADGGRIATVASRRGLHTLAIVDVGDGSVRFRRKGLRHIKHLTAAGDRLAFSEASFRRANEVVSTTWDGDDRSRLSRFNRKWFGRRALPRVSKRTFEVPDGSGGTERIEGWVLLPAQGDGPFPLMVDFHGGPQSVVLIDFDTQVYWYALLSQGWAVMALNAVGSGGYGERFATRLRGRWGELDMPQHVAAIETLQREGLADDRVVCAGKSYGGYLSAWAIGHCSVFRACMVAAPVANVESHAGTSDTGYYVTPYAMDGEISEHVDRYRALSPVEGCASGGIPVLLLQGDDDQRCPLGQSEELFARLIRCTGAGHVMVVYPGGAHGLSATGRPSHRVDYHQRTVNWFRDNVGVP
jgi:dipeptidyl aminopeptidase/acylaminoacyl peptidase